jgi:hypothetical protein
MQAQQAPGVSKYFLLIVLLITTLSGCERKCYVLPAPTQGVAFHIVDNKHPVKLADIRLYWYEGGYKSYEDQVAGSMDLPLLRIEYPVLGYDTLTRENIVDSTRPMLYSVGLVSNASYKNINVFYVDYGNGEIDTLNVDVATETVKEKHCSVTNRYLRSITYKGAKLEADPDSAYVCGYQRAFLLKRQ